MNYKDFKNIHKEQQIIVCGCGISLTDFKNNDDYITIAVNDIGRYITPNYLVILNNRNGFKGDRWKYVENTGAPVLFTQYRDLPVNDKSKIVGLKLGKYAGTVWNKEEVSYTTNSPYVATIIAAYMGASHIGLIGVDFTQDHFWGKTGEHPLANRFNAINDEYNKLHKALQLKNIDFVNLSKHSRLTMPKMDIDTFTKCS